MTRVHTLTAQLSAGGLTLNLTCPYAGETPDVIGSYPDWMRPVCRPAGTTSCQAGARLAEQGPAALWGGPPTGIASIPVNLWAAETGLKLTAANPPPPAGASVGTAMSAEAVARKLASASRSPRYHDGKHSKLLESLSDVDFAWREAVRMQADRPAMDALRAWLVDWHHNPSR